MGRLPLSDMFTRVPRVGPPTVPWTCDVRIIVSSTPKFAKMVSSKYAEFGSARVQHDLRGNHGRVISRCLIQDVADAVATVALVKEEAWSYHLPKLEDAPSDRCAEFGWHLHPDAEDGCEAIRRWGPLALTIAMVKDSPRSIRRRPLNMGRRRFWVDWRLKISLM